MTALLETRGLGRAFGALQAVAGVSLAVEPGEVRAVIGPNGAGKTTLFHLISGLLAPTSGRVLFRGDDVTALPAPARCRRGISRTFQITSIFPELSVLENVRIAVQLRSGGNFRLVGGRATLEASEQRARASLGSLGLLGQVAREQKLTIILVEHDMDVVFDLADRISVLHFGQLIAEGTPDQIRANADVQRAYLGGAE